MKIKILFLIPNLAYGGAERVLVNLVNNMDTNRFDITVQTLFDVGVNRQYLKEHVRYIGGMKHQFRGNSHVIKLFSPKVLYRYFIKERYDIVVSFLEGITARIIAGCSDPDVKKICWLHTELNSPALASRCFRSLDEANQYYNRYDRIVAVSERVKQVFIENLRMKTPVDVLYNTNETELIRCKADESIDHPLFITGDVPCLCSTGKIISVKGFERLLNVHKRLMKEGYQHRIFILGTGELKKELEQKIMEYNLQESFILLGFQKNPYKFVAKCDAYICSSYREGFSTAVTEALILGIPVISTDCAGAKELLGNQDEYGLVVENSEEGIYQGMQKFLANPILLNHYKEQAIVRGQVFSREKTVKAVEEMLESL